MLADRQQHYEYTTSLAIGILTVDDEHYAWRRSEQRSAWANEARSLPNCFVRFVFRCGQPSYASAATATRRNVPSPALQHENATNGGDMLCLHAVPLDAGKLKGPSLSVVAWFELVLAMNKDHGDRSSHFVATVDDDAYIHVPGVHRRRESITKPRTRCLQSCASCRWMTDRMMTVCMRSILPMQKTCSWLWRVGHRRLEGTCTPVP